MIKKTPTVALLSTALLLITTSCGTKLRPLTADLVKAEPLSVVKSPSRYT